MGFERIGFTQALPLEQSGLALDTWLSHGYAGEMDYLEKNAHARWNPQDHLPNAKTVVAVAANYFDGDSDGCDSKVARYAHGKDYHKVLGNRLQALARYLEFCGTDVRSKIFVDTGALLERAFAQTSGLGFIGKNTLLITKGMGSFVFLGSLVTTLEIEADAPDTRSCGSCRLCIDACPTQAILEPFHLDARKCISYLTIEQKGPVPEPLRGPMGDWLFGCDVCQDVCPHNTRLPRATLAEFLPSSTPLKLQDIFQMDAAAFEERFRGSPMRRAGRDGLLRNACVVAANTDRKDLLPILQTVALNDSSALVREHAAWAVQQLTNESA